MRACCSGPCPTKSWISPVLEVPHPLWIIFPLLNCAHSEILFPCVSLEFPLCLLLPRVSSLSTSVERWTSPSVHWIVVDSSNIFPEPLLAEQGCLTQFLLLWGRVTCAVVPSYLCDHLWDFIWSVHCGLHCVWKPKAGHSFLAVTTPVLERGEGSLP